MNTINGTPQATIDIFQDHAKIKINSNNGSEVKFVGLKQVENLLTAQSVSTPVFPVWVSYYKSDGVNVRILTTRKVGIYEEQYQSSSSSNEAIVKIVKLHFPYFHMLWHLYREPGDKYRVQDSALFTSFRAPGDSTNIYIPNIGNIDPKTGDICWGDALNFMTPRFPIEDLAQLENTLYLCRHNNDRVAFDNYKDSEHRG